ncbi:type II toxin-antitoxin system Phd/YefM family antitoxin [Phenylobacterium aquaticum]|uniref:type II toxin-antitoxin system Phd/YefM family antitoxin n=1 Tax=Phenylobacterium aquaticum TaxID=1763816 RepID=UPI0026EB1630|nr:type II toxin-antitoxin system prevent-host-death family antitoxin [Phenylobacterium aquaticum]
MASVNIAEAKARLSELIAQAQAGDPVSITRRGKPAAQLIAAGRPRKPLDLEALQALTASMPRPDIAAESIVRQMRDEDRY